MEMRIIENRMTMIEKLSESVSADDELWYWNSWV